MEIIADKQPIPKELKRLRKFVRLMDSAFRIPNTNFTFGLDPIINLIPYGGAAVGYIISVYLMFAMYQNGASSKVMGKMIWNVTIDALVGAIPILGGFFDFYYKANERNMILAMEHFEEGKHQGSVLPYLIPILLILFVIIAGSIAATVFALKFLFGIFTGIIL